jgi:hypothetical protein
LKFRLEVAIEVDGVDAGLQQDIEVGVAVLSTKAGQLGRGGQLIDGANWWKGSVKSGSGQVEQVLYPVVYRSQENAKFALKLDWKKSIDQINSKISQAANKKGINQSDVKWEIKLNNLQLLNENELYCF